jgi:hypothetical protein
MSRNVCCSFETALNEVCMFEATDGKPFSTSLLSLVWVTIDGGLNWILDLLTTYRSNLHITFYSSLEHTVQCSQPVTRRFLVMAATMAIPLPFGSDPLFTYSHAELTKL